jgi:hypothetical protein
MILMQFIAFIAFLAGVILLWGITENMVKSGRIICFLPFFFISINLFFVAGFCFYETFDSLILAFNEVSLMLFFIMALLVIRREKCRIL